MEEGTKGTYASEPTAMTYGMSDELRNSDLKPYTLDELYARLQESHEQYLRGEYYTEEKVRAELKKEFLWLQ